MVTTTSELFVGTSGEETRRRNEFSTQQEVASHILRRMITIVPT